MMSHAGPMNIADSILDRQTRGVFFSARAGCDPKGSRTCRPRIGVLPPEAVNGSDGEKRLAIGLASEIATTLTRSPALVIVASQSLVYFAERTRDEAAIRQEFAIDYLLDGSVQHVGKRVRVTLRLLDLNAGDQVTWAQRFDGRDDDPFSLQDEISEAVAAQIDPEAIAAEART